jgi:hypothetical protein
MSCRNLTGMFVILIADILVLVRKGHSKQLQPERVDGEGAI